MTSPIKKRAVFTPPQRACAAAPLHQTDRAAAPLLDAMIRPAADMLGQLVAARSAVNAGADDAATLHLARAQAALDRLGEAAKLADLA